MREVRLTRTLHYGRHGDHGGKTATETPRHRGARRGRPATQAACSSGHATGKRRERQMLSFVRRVPARRRRYAAPRRALSDTEVFSLPRGPPGPSITYSLASPTVYIAKA